LEKERVKKTTGIFRLEETKNEQYDVTLAVVTKSLNETLTSETDHVAKQGKKPSDLSLQIHFLCQKDRSVKKHKNIDFKE
jgi:hypothetical protein